MKAFASLIVTASVVLASSAFAKTCTAQSVTEGIQVLGITLQPYLATIRIMNETGNFPRTFQFDFSQSKVEGPEIYYVGQSFKMVYNITEQAYEIDAVLNQIPGISPGRLVHFTHVTCQE